MLIPMNVKGKSVRLPIFPKGGNCRFKRIEGRLQASPYLWMENALYQVGLSITVSFKQFRSSRSG